MVHSESATTWDVIVIGGAPPGEIAAQYAIQGSDRTAVIVEHELMGGECSYWACMPSKALLRPIEVLDAARHMPGVASIVGDLVKLQQRDRPVVGRPAAQSIGGHGVQPLLDPSRLSDLFNRRVHVLNYLRGPLIPAQVRVPAGTQ